MKGDDFYFSQTRLYYLVYVCDHHFSIAYGRPPLTRDYEEISKVKEILLLPQATEDDARLVSQVELWGITSRVLETFGFDTELAPPQPLISRMRRFAIEYDTWRADWNDRFGRHVHVGNYPRKGVKLHVNFAKLYLCSHAFRGLTTSCALQGDVPLSTVDKSPVRPIPQTSSVLGNGVSQGDSHGILHSDLEDMATVAVQAAQNILETMVSDPEIQTHLDGVPLCFNTMIAFAVVFLFKIATRYSHVIDIDADRTLALVVNVASTLKSVTSNMSSRHLLVTVSRAVEALSDSQKRSNGGAPPIATHEAENIPTPMRLPPWLDPNVATDTIEVGNTNWGIDADFDWMTYDFLAPDGIFIQPDLQYIGEDQTQHLI